MGKSISLGTRLICKEHQRRALTARDPKSTKDGP